MCILAGAMSNVNFTPDKYFRIGYVLCHYVSFVIFNDLFPLFSHMGITAIDLQRGDLDKIINALADSLLEVREAKGVNK